MSYKQLSTERILGDYYEHVIDTNNDSTYFLDENKDIIFTVDSTARVFNENDEYIGEFRIDSNDRWKYSGKDGEVFIFDRSLIKAETQLFSILIVRG